MELIVPLSLLVESSEPSPSAIMMIVVATPPLHTATTESPVDTSERLADFPSVPVTVVVALAVKVSSLPFTDTETEYPLPELVFCVTLPAY